MKIIVISGYYFINIFTALQYDNIRRILFNEFKLNKNFK